MKILISILAIILVALVTFLFCMGQATNKETDTLDFGNIITAFVALQFLADAIPVIIGVIIGSAISFFILKKSITKIIDQRTREIIEEVTKIKHLQE